MGGDDWHVGRRRAGFRLVLFRHSRLPPRHHAERGALAVCAVVAGEHRAPVWRVGRPGYRRRRAIRKLYGAGKRLYPPPGHARGAEPFADGDVPVIDASGAFVITDNQLALMAGWDDELLRLEVTELRDEGFDVDLLGFEPVELDTLLGGGTPAAAQAAAREWLADRLLIPPFSVFNARDGWWQDRKRSWVALGLDRKAGATAI